MSLVDELLDTARRLVATTTPSPTDADIRRAISTAYYAVFHRLIDVAVNHLLPTHSADQHAGLGRAFEHTKMRDVCQRIGNLAKQQNPRPLPPLARILGSVVPPELQKLAESFCHLQQLRSEADYDRVPPINSMTLRSAQDAIGEASDAFANWVTLETTSKPIAQAFLLLLLTGEPKNRT